MKYFTIPELISSAIAKAKKIDNTPSKEAIQNLEQLIEKVLDPLREVYGKPIRVNSGLRSPALNKAVGGSKTSDHMKGMAADITGDSKAENKKIFELIKKLNLPFKQLIDEKNFSWVHVSYDPKNIKRQILKL